MPMSKAIAAVVVLTCILMAGTAYGQENATGDTEDARALAERVYLAYAATGALSVSVRFQQGSVLDMSVADGMYRWFVLDKVSARKTIVGLVQQMRDANPSGPSPLVRIHLAGKEVIRGQATASGVEIKYAE